MNDIIELVSHGIPKSTAELMLADYKKRIGTRNGIYEIIDINYDFEKRAKDVVLRCTDCFGHTQKVKAENLKFRKNKKGS